METNEETYLDIPLDDATFRKELGLPAKLSFSKFKNDLTAADLRKEIPTFLRPHLARLRIALTPIAEFSPSNPQQGPGKYLDFFHPTYVLTYSNTPGYQQGIANFDSKYQGEFYPGYFVRPAVQLHYPLTSSPFVLFGHVVKFFIRLSEAKVYRFKRTVGSVPAQTSMINFHNAPGEFAISFTPGQSTAYMLLEQMNSVADNAKWTFVKAVVYRKDLVIQP